jgi:hypothetical protein
VVWLDAGFLTTDLHGWIWWDWFLGVFGFNSEPNKKLRLTTPLASQESGIESWILGFGVGCVEIFAAEFLTEF